LIVALPTSGLVLMPELPEVEVVRRALAGALVQRRCTSVTIRQSQLRWPVSPEVRHLGGQVLRQVNRRGKYLLLGFDDGTLIAHLGMSGSFLFFHEAPPLRQHDHVDLAFEHGVLRYHDPRRFGAMLWHPHQAGPIAQHTLLAKLGIEPLQGRFADEGGQLLFKASRGKTLSIKQFLLAGHAVVGVGNIYASECLFRAGIRPGIAAGRVSAKRYDRLAREIVQVLGQAIEAGGSTLRDFHSTQGEAGDFQSRHFVYDRRGQPCYACAHPIVLTVQQARSSYWCRVCQR
jgi:formamidopyrimidine-DNA glycosylase